MTNDDHLRALAALEAVVQNDDGALEVLAGGAQERPLAALLAAYGKHTLERVLLAAFGIEATMTHDDTGQLVAELNGDRMGFGQASFSSGMMIFSGARFSGGVVGFGGTSFSGGGVAFDGATFNGGTVGFGGTTFSGSTVSFRRADFFARFQSRAAVSFSGATCYDGEVDFSGAGALPPEGLLDAVASAPATVRFVLPSRWTVVNP